MKFEVVCNKCEYEFSVNEIDLRKEYVNCNGDKLSLTFFTCPKCNEIYKVALEDEACDLLKEDLNKTIKRIRRNFGNNNKVLSETLNHMVFQKKKRLKNHMMKLNALYSGTFTFDTSENKEKDNMKIIYHE